MKASLLRALTTGAVLVLLARPSWAQDPMMGNPPSTVAAVRVWTQDANCEMTFEIAPDGKVSLDVKEKAAGKNEQRQLRADSWAEFRVRFADAVREYNLDRYAPSEGGIGEEVRRLFNGAENALPGIPPRLGVWVVDPSAALASQLGLPQGEGVLVTSVDLNSLAERIGVQRHDVILTLDGRPVMGWTDFGARIHEAIPRGFVMEILRKGQRIQLGAPAPTNG